MVTGGHFDFSDLPCMDALRVFSPLPNQQVKIGNAKASDAFAPSKQNSSRFARGITKRRIFVFSSDKTGSP